MLGEYDEEVQSGAGEGHSGGERFQDEDFEEEMGEFDDDGALPPLQTEDEKELLFLIEFLVDTLRVRRQALTDHHLDPCVLQGQHCITLTFLHFPPMSICETDVGGDKNVGLDETVFNSGKSLVFALTESQFEEPPPVFLEVSVFKEMPHGFPIQRIQIGKTKVDLSELFRMVFDKYDEKPGELPVSKSIKDNYVICANGKESADVDIYIRLTCLGQNIVTEFQKSNGICDPFLFKNLESEKIYECKQTLAKEETTSKSLNCGRAKQQKGRRKVPDPEDEKYEQIYVEINGSALTVDVEKNKRIEKPKPYRVEDFCDCNIPLPPELVEGVSEPSLPLECMDNQELPDGGVGKCNNKIIFQVPPSDKLAQPDGWNNVSYKVHTCNEAKKHGHVGTNSFQITTDDDVPRPKMPNDPEKDVFVLKIFKKGKMNKGKGALELEFRTPKEKIVPPPKPPYMIERAVGPEKQKDKKGKKK